MTGVQGFEPRNVWTKTRCLTTWRHPIIFLARFTSYFVCAVINIAEGDRVLSTYLAKNISTSIKKYLVALAKPSQTQKAVAHAARAPQLSGF